MPWVRLLGTTCKPTSFTFTFNVFAVVKTLLVVGMCTWLQKTPQKTRTRLKLVAGRALAFIKMKPEIVITGHVDSVAVQGSQLNSALKRFAVGSKTYRSVETVDPERPVKKNE